MITNPPYIAKLRYGIGGTPILLWRIDEFKMKDLINLSLLKTGKAEINFEL